MKLIIRIILIGTLTYFVSPYFTWWTGMATAFLVCLALPSSSLNAFVAGFLGVGVAWFVQAITLDIANQSTFTEVIIELLSVPVITDPFALVLATGLIGGISGGFAGATGASLRQANQKKKNRGGYYS